jgi:hypothetical protein
MLCHETVRQTDRAADRPTDSRVGAEKKRADIAYTHSGSQSRNYHVQPSADIDSETALGKEETAGAFSTLAPKQAHLTPLYIK